MSVFPKHAYVIPNTRNGRRFRGWGDGGIVNVRPAIINLLPREDHLLEMSRDMRSLVRVHVHVDVHGKERKALPSSSQQLDKSRLWDKKCHLRRPVQLGKLARASRYL